MSKFPNLKKNQKTTDSENPPEKPGRITNETVLQHRDEVLKKGRQFKYPFHRSKHRIAIISITLVVLGLVVLGLFTSWQLYRKQSIGTFTYRVTQIFPFPVASVNGTRVSYESYLFELNPAIHWLENYGTTDLRSPDGQRQIEHNKRQALDKAMTNAITRTFAKQQGVTVSAQEVNEAIDRVKLVGGNLDTILSDQYGFGESEFRRLKRDTLLREKVAMALDTEAPKQAAAALAELQSGASFVEVVAQYSDDDATKGAGGELGIVERGHANVPPTVEDAIFTTKVGEFTEVIKASNAYYIIQVTDKPAENKAKVSLIQIRVKSMDQYLQDYKDQGKVREFIRLTGA